MNLEEFNAKVDALKAEGRQLALDGDLEAAEAKKTEIEELTNAFEAEKAQKAEENAIEKTDAVPEQVQTLPKMGEENEKMEKIFDASSVEYKNAFLKHISGRDDQMTELENAAFVHTTQNTPNVLPTTMVNEIWDLVSHNHVIAADVTTYRTGTILEVVKHTEIKAGAAKKVAEGVANDDEQNTFVKVTLAGKDYAKSVELSYAEAEMALDALESYITTEIANSIGEAIANDIVTAITGGIATANKIATAAGAAVSFKNIAAAFGSLKRAVAPVVYCTRATLYNHIVTLQDSANQNIFQPSAVPGVAGTLLGAEIKIEDSVADGTILIGDPKKVVNNVVTDVMVETDKDIKAHKYIYSGYARCEATLIDDKAFATVTATPKA